MDNQDWTDLKFVRRVFSHKPGEVPESDIQDARLILSRLQKQAWLDVKAADEARIAQEQYEQRRAKVREQSNRIKCYLAVVLFVVLFLRSIGAWKWA